jgi:periplasmic protein CpxP/Spy
MRADHFRDKRIEAAHQFASRLVIVAQRARNQRICVTIIHVVVEAVSTLLAMTGSAAFRLQISLAEVDKIKCNRELGRTVTNYEMGNSILMKTKLNLLTIAAIGAIALAGYAFAQPQGESDGPGHFRHGMHGQGFALAHLTKSLNLTPDQQSKVQPLIDQARPQIIAIHKEAMEKTHAIIDKTMTQIRPMLTPEQQKKFDALQKARQDMRNAMQEMHAAMQQ